jgi:ferredoxin
MSAAERFSDFDHSAIVLDSKKCTHTHDQLSACTGCFEICPVGAIQPGEPPSLDAEKCDSCLACLPVCPVGAYTAEDGVGSLLTCTARLETKAVELVCRRHEHADAGASPSNTGIRVRGCLAGLGTGTYMALAACGMEKIILRLDACKNCSWGSLQMIIQNQVEQAADMLAHWGKREILFCLTELHEGVDRPLWDANNPPLSRRDLFRMAAQQGQMTLARAMSADRSGSQRQPGRDRNRVVSALAHLPEPEQHLDEPIETSSYIGLSVSEKCSACAACARACPTSALHYELGENKTHYRLLIKPQACVACEGCVHVCAPGAIEVDRTPTFRQVFGNPEPVVLSEGDVLQCSHCKTYFSSRTGGRLCPVCEYRRTHPFGSIMPPGVRPINEIKRGQNPHDS